MGIYYFIIALLLVECLAFNNNQPNQKSKKIFFWMTLLFLALVAGCRSYDVGNDTYNYGNIFVRIGTMTFHEMLSENSFSDMEQGYVWLCWLFYKLSSNYSHFLIVTALFEFAVVGSWIWKNANRPYIALLIFFCLFYTFFLTGIRQTLALCITLLAYEDVKNNRFFRFSIKVLAAMLFHFSAILAFGVYIVPRVFHNSGKTCLAMMLLLPVLYVIRDRLFPLVIGIFARYSDWQILQQAEPLMFTMMLVLVVLVSQIMQLIQPIRHPQEYQRYCVYTNYIIIAVLIMPFVGMNMSIERAALYYETFICLQIEKIYGRFTDRRTRITVVLLSLILLVVLFIQDLPGSPYVYEFVGMAQLLS